MWDQFIPYNLDNEKVIGYIVRVTEYVPEMLDIDSVLTYNDDNKLFRRHNFTGSIESYMLEQHPNHEHLTCEYVSRYKVYDGYMIVQPTQINKWLQGVV